MHPSVRYIHSILKSIHVSFLFFISKCSLSVFYNQISLYAYPPKLGDVGGLSEKKALENMSKVDMSAEPTLCEDRFSPKMTCHCLFIKFLMINKSKIVVSELYSFTTNLCSCYYLLSARPSPGCRVTYC